MPLELSVISRNIKDLLSICAGAHFYSSSLGIVVAFTPHSRCHYYVYILGTMAASLGIPLVGFDDADNARDEAEPKT